MNAPATLQDVRPDPHAAGPDLLAWPLIRALIAFDTTSRDSNLALIDWVRNLLAGHGIESALTFDDDRCKAKSADSEVYPD